MKKQYWPAMLGLGIGLSLSVPNSSMEGILASVKASGMGGAGAAYAVDAMAGAINPAAMSDVCDRFDVAIMPVHSKQEVDVSGSPVPVGVNGHFENSLKNFYNPTFGINKQFDWCCWEMSIGLMGYNQGHLDSTFNNSFPLLGTGNLQLDVTQEVIAPVWTVKINECHAVGLALDVVVQSLKIKGLQNFDNAIFSSAPGHVTNEGRDYSWGVGVTLGYIGHWTDWLSVGVAYQPKIAMSRFDKYKGFLAQRGKLDIPQTVNAGIALHLIPCMNIAFDVDWIDWEGIRSLHNPLLPNLLVSKLGRNNGVGFGWKNQIFYRVGVDYQLFDCWTIRAGYRHANTPVRGSQAATNILTCETCQDFVTVGASYQTDCWGEFSAFYAYGFDHEVKGPGSIPVVPLGGGNVNLKQQQQAFGLNWGYNF